MLSIINEDKALKFVSKYFTSLEKTGYLPHNITQWYLAYLFLIDFYNWLYPYFSNDDYKNLYMAFVKLFSGGNCLVPYQMFSIDKIRIARHVGLAHYTGPSVLRKTIASGTMRMTENRKVRRTE